MLVDPGQHSSTPAGDTDPVTSRTDVTTAVIEANGLSFTADVAGPADGELVLLLHGFPQTRHTWRAELPALAAAGFRACAPDQRGYSAGARPDGIESYRTELLVADALAIADSRDAPGERADDVRVGESGRHGGPHGSREHC